MKGNSKRISGDFTESVGGLEQGYRHCFADVTNRVNRSKITYETQAGMYALTFSYVNFLSGPMSVVLILNTSFFFRSNVSSVLHINRNELKQSILHFCQFFSYMHLRTLFCFYKNVVFPAQVEYSYFSAIFRLDFILVLFSNQRIFRFVGSFSRLEKGRIYMVKLKTKLYSIHRFSTQKFVSFSKSQPWVYS